MHSKQTVEFVKHMVMDYNEIDIINYTIMISLIVLSFDVSLSPIA